MLSHEEMVTLADGQQLFVRKWSPDGSPKAIVILVHGHGDHTGRFQQVAEVFTKAGYLITGFDTRGHGRSSGIRGHYTYTKFADDMDFFVDRVIKTHPGLPVILYGHSMGAGQIINYCLRRKPDVKAVIATSPLLKLGYYVPPAKLKLTQILSRFLPSLTVASGVNANYISRDPVVNDAYVADPLVHSRASTALGWDLYFEGLWNLEHAAEFNLPILVLQGSQDHFVDPQATKEFVGKLDGKATFVWYEGYMHELHNEPEKAVVLATMTDWLDQLLDQ